MGGKWGDAASHSEVGCKWVEMWQRGCQHPTSSKITADLQMGCYIPPLTSHLRTKDTACLRSLKWVVSGGMLNPIPKWDVLNGWKCDEWNVNIPLHLKLPLICKWDVTSHHLHPNWGLKKLPIYGISQAELGTSLFQIAKSLIAI